VSSEVPEVLGLADRVLVVREGRIVHEAPAEDLDEHRVLDLVMVSAQETSGPASDSASDSGSASGSEEANPPSEGAFHD
jgi:ribose transport system ATP-binding protein